VDEAKSIEVQANLTHMSGFVCQQNEYEGDYENDVK